MINQKLVRNLQAVYGCMKGDIMKVVNVFPRVIYMHSSEETVM